MADETKICEGCDQEIGSNETKCPKCGVVFADLDEEVQVVTRAMTIAEKRRKASLPPEPIPEPAPEPTLTPKKRSVFKSLSKAVMK